MFELVQFSGSFSCLYQLLRQPIAMTQQNENELTVGRGVRFTTIGRKSEAFLSARGRTPRSKARAP